MSNDSNKNNLEDFFRNSLKQYSENPSDDLWGKIEAGIPPKPSGRFKPAYALLFLLVLLTIGLGYEYFRFKSQMIAVNETVASQKQDLDRLQNELESVKDQLQSTGQSLEYEPFDSQPSTPKEASAENPPTGKAKGSASASRATIAVSGVETREAVVINNDLITEETAQTQPEGISENAEVVPPLVYTASFLEPRPTSLTTSAAYDLPKIQVPKESGKAFSVEIYSSLLKSFLNDSNPPANKAAVEDFKLSFDAGALFNMGLNKHWDIQLGVGYNHMVLNDAVSTELTYEREELDSERGVYTSFYSYNVNTPAGDMVVNTSLSNQKINDGRDLEDGDPFQLNLQYQDAIQYFQLPVFIRYKMGSGKYRFTLRGGIIQKFLLDEKIKLRSVNPEVERLHNEMSHISNNQTSAATTSVDALFGAGVEYRLSKLNSLHLQTTFSHSLREIYPGIKPVSIGLNLGLQHRIGR